MPYAPADEKPTGYHLIFTDGACSGNPGKGGFGVILRYRNYEKEISEGYRLTTNNRMELMAVIRGLEQLKKEGSVVKVISDSKYVVEAIEKKWIENWQRKQWKKVKNPDLWKQLLQQLSKHHVTFEWVKGHNLHPENERCDELAVEAYQQHFLKEDAGYVQVKDKNLF